MSEREYENNFEDYDGQQQVLEESTGKLQSNLCLRINDHLKQLIQKWEHGLNGISLSDNSLYTGTAGIALAYYKLSCINADEPKYLEKAVFYADKAIQKVASKRPLAFMCGDLGALTVAAIVFSKANHPEACKTCLDNLRNMSKAVVQDDDIPNEVLFGRAGYLLGALYVREKLGATEFHTKHMQAVVDKILEDGQKLSRKEKSRSPLMFAWHDKHYVGAAHGISGILYLLLKVDDCVGDEKLQSLVKPAVDYIISKQFPSGNFPSSLENPSDLLVHWCHGAPGVVYMCIEAYEVFSDEKYLKAAVECGELVWKRGLLRKGYGLCHGVAGNAYIFLSLFLLTQDQKYLHRAVKFAEWCFHYGKHGKVPDRPYSLFEGLAGTIYFLADILEPGKARLPVFGL